jgi:TonB family protein
VSVFSGLQSLDSSRDPPSRRDCLHRHRTVAVSVGAHLVALAVIVFHHPRAVELSPTWLAGGNAAHTYQITYLPSGNEENAADESKLAMPARPQAARSRPRPQTRKPQPAEPQRQLEANADAGDVNTKAGSPLGRFVDGPISGHDVHVAYPIVYPEPIDRSELPRDLAGDVVIEVTIDAQGNVVDTRIVQSIGRGIDEKIEATLRRWRYEPATLDGTPVASHHDVHFHFPS